MRADIKPGEEEEEGETEEEEDDDDNEEEEDDDDDDDEADWEERAEVKVEAKEGTAPETEVIEGGKAMCLMEESSMPAHAISSHPLKKAFIQKRRRTLLRISLRGTAVMDT